MKREWTTICGCGLCIENARLNKSCKKDEELRLYSVNRKRIGLNKREWEAVNEEGGLLLDDKNQAR
jgi:hypothetical protein